MEMTASAANTGGEISEQLMLDQRVSKI